MGYDEIFKTGYEKTESKVRGVHIKRTSFFILGIELWADQEKIIDREFP